MMSLGDEGDPKMKESMTSTVGKLAIAAAAMVVLIGLTPPALAASPSPIETVTATFTAAKEWLSDSLTSLFGGASTDAVTPPSPSDVLRQVGGAGHSEFWDYLKDAGYDLSEIETSVGIIPDIKITFLLVRELSEADRDWLQQELEVDALRRKSLVAKLQRRIIQTLLDASEFQDMRIGKLVLGILPLPSADFVVEPANAPLSEEHDTIYRAVLNKSGRKPSTKPAGEATDR